jgi:hypothetical protein
LSETTVTIQNELEIRAERVFDAPRAHVFSDVPEHLQTLELRSQ